MATRMFVDGIDVVSLRAIPAFRIRVSMSLIGSFTLMRCVSVVFRRLTYQLDFVTPGRLPFDANSRKQIRHVPNLRMYARLRPQSLQRLTARV
jgi:hypothetical protein